LFYELGYDILKPKGILTFITSNKWMRAAYGESLRKFFAEKTNPEILIDFSGNQIFDTATVDTNILTFTRIK
jgi:anti-anti-sigma regulatory factor